MLGAEGDYDRNGNANRSRVRQNAGVVSRVLANAATIGVPGREPEWMPNRLSFRRVEASRAWTGRCRRQMGNGEWGNANLLIGVGRPADREIGVPGMQNEYS
jgi:hypothetical protein